MSLHARKHFGHSPARRSVKARPPRVEILDDRLLLSTFTVANLGDAGPGSLRSAIVAANSAPGADTIDFSVAGSIPLASALPAITDRVDINGTSAPGFAQNPVVEVDFAGFSGLRFEVGSAGSALKSLGLVRAGSDGVTLNDRGNLVTGNFIGVRLDGATAGGNLGNGLTINPTSGDNIIGATTTVGTTTVLPLASNLISANRDGGIVVLGSSGNRFTANYVGTNISGTAALGNGGNGIRFDSGASSNTVGGIIPFVSSRGLVPLSNLISGNRGSGVRFAGGSSSNFLAANFVGTDATGNAPLGNLIDGMTIVEGSNDNTLQGTVFGESPFIYANIISGNLGNGLRIANSNGTVIQANFLGLGYDNKTPVGNALNGLLVEGTSSTTTMGGVIPLGNVTAANGRNGVELRDTASGFTSFNTFAGLAAFQVYTNLGNGMNGFLISSTGGGNLLRTNVISSNLGNGVELAGSATGVQVTDNEIGVTTNGAAALPNGANGILVGGNASGNTIGGKLDSFSIIPHNVISANVGHGIAFVGTANNNSVTYSFIGTNIEGTTALGNGGSGIFLAPGTFGNLIGGSEADSFNIISGNLGNGVQLSGTSGNAIAGNFIGVDVTRVIPLGNGGSGVFIDASSNNRIGGSASNTIAFNGAAGVFVKSGTGNAIVNNSIYDNGSKGIVIQRGANQDQAAPVLTFLKRCNNRSAIRGLLRSVANLPYRVEFFSNARPGVRSAASGQTSLGTIQVTTNAQGVARFRRFLNSLPRHTFFTAIATSSAGDSSEFSNAIPK